MMIDKFKPLWNTTIAGFGNHDPGSGRANQQRSAWDTLHPGRPWAANLRTNLRSISDIVAAAERAIAARQRPGAADGA